VSLNLGAALRKSGKTPTNHTLDQSGAKEALRIRTPGLLSAAQGEQRDFRGNAEAHRGADSA
jgi:hypothetical protein